MSDDFLLLKLIFINCGSKFNWAYYDRYGNNQIGQLGYGFSLILLSKYGQERRLDRFYADKYFKAFPKLIEDSINADFGIFENQIADCYSLRTFDRFLDYFGLIKIELSSHNWDADKFVTKTDLFDKMIKCKPSN